MSGWIFNLLPCFFLAKFTFDGVKRLQVTDGKKPDAAADSVAVRDGSAANIG